MSSGFTAVNRAMAGRRARRSAFRPTALGRYRVCLHSTPKLGIVMWDLENITWRQVTSSLILTQQRVRSF